MKRLVMLLLLLALGSPAFAQTSTLTPMCPGITTPITSKGYAQASVTSVVVATLTVPSGAMMAVVEVETAAIRYRDDGTSPTTSVGTPVASAGTVVICGTGLLSAWQAIAQSATAKLNTTFYGR